MEDAEVEAGCAVVLDDDVEGIILAHLVMAVLVTVIWDGRSRECKAQEHWERLASHFGGLFRIDFVEDGQILKSIDEQKAQR